MTILLKAFLVALICVPVFIPLAHAGTVAPSPVDDLEDAELQQLEEQTCQEVKDIQGGRSKLIKFVKFLLYIALVAALFLLTWDSVFS